MATIKRHRKTNIGQAGLGLSSNGKGDKSRVTDRKAYEANYAEIDWGRPRNTCEHGIHFDEQCGQCLSQGRMNSWDVSPRRA